MLLTVLLGYLKKTVRPLAIYISYKPRKDTRHTAFLMLASLNVQRIPSIIATRGMISVLNRCDLISLAPFVGEGVPVAT